ERGVGGEGREVPAELVAGVQGMLLGVSATGQVADDAAAALRAQSCGGPAQAELGLAGARGSGDDGQGTGQRPPAEVPVQTLDAKWLAAGRHKHRVPLAQKSP